MSYPSIFVRVVLLLVLSLALPGAIAQGIAAEKKGIAINARLDNPSQRIKSLNVSWYYDWSAKPIPGVQGAEFVPLVWGGKYNFDKNVEFLKRGAPYNYILGFNEPDQPTQGAMSVERALELWPTVTKLGKSVGSPALARPLSPWMDQFISGLERSQLRVDFITLHWYGPPRAEGFLKFVDRVYQRYQKPIWITEFAVADWSTRNGGTNAYSERQVLCFMQIALPELEKRGYVSRYSWYAGHLREAHRPSQLFRPDGGLTTVGEYYAKFGTANQVEQDYCKAA